MIPLFSQRYKRVLTEHENLRKLIRVSSELREAIRRLMYRYSERDWDSYYGVIFVSIGRLETRLCESLGWKTLQKYDRSAGEMRPVQDFEEFIEKTPHKHVLDAIELYYQLLAEHSKGEFQRDLNEIFSVHHYPLRLFEGQLWVLREEFLEEAIISETFQKLKEIGCAGAIRELHEAYTYYTQKDYNGAILSTNKAMESTLMCICPEAAGKKLKELIASLRKADLIPSYHLEFLEAFYRIIYWVPTIRNNEAAHGQGVAPREVPPALAEFALHMTYAVVLFLVKRYLERYPMPRVREESSTQLEEDSFPPDDDPLDDELPF